MCRWLAYYGDPILIEDLIYRPEHSLIDQSLHSTMGVETTNGDGFGVGWYEGDGAPALFKGIDPAWSNRNLRELSKKIRSGLFFAHVRASTGSPAQYTNCHPFRYGRWLWMHNGQINRFREVKRELVLAVDPALYPFIEGTTDTEVFFYLALTFGLEEDPPRAVGRAVGFIEEVCRKNGIGDAMRMSVAASNGTTVWAFRYSTEGEAPSLFFSAKSDTLRQEFPEVEDFQSLSDETRVVISEPLGSRKGMWLELPHSHYAVVGPGDDELLPFSPAA
jgi:predicted glutamine amidotransferase